MADEPLPPLPHLSLIDRGQTQVYEPRTGWLFGDKLRRFGSVHSDRWTGMAIDLASRDHIAVYPVVGWWRQRIHRGRCNATARFSLIVSLEASDVDIDLYTAIQTQLEIPIEPVIEV